MSHRLEPRERRLEKDSWPGVSMIMRPGMRSVPEPGVTSRFLRATSGPMRSTRVSCGK